jgi:hypothetical protein
MMLLFRFRLWLRDLLRPLTAKWLDLPLPEKDPDIQLRHPDPEVGRLTFDIVNQSTGQYINRFKFAPGTEPFEVMAAALNAAAGYNLLQKNPMALEHNAYAVRVKWEIDLEPLDPDSFDAPVWDGEQIRGAIRKFSGVPEKPEGKVLSFPKTRT